MKKICIISNSTSSILIFRKHFIKFLIHRGFEVFCLSIDYTIESKKDVQALGAIPIDYKLSRGGLNPIIDGISIIKLSKLLKKIDPDIVFSTFSKPVIYGTLAAKKAGVRNIVGMIEGLGYFFTEQPNGTTPFNYFVRSIQIILYKIALPKLHKLVLLNFDDYNDLLKKYHINVKRPYILGGIGLNLNEYKFSKPPIKKVSFLFIARLLKEKGIYEFMSAAKSLKIKYPNVEFKIAGSFDTENPGSLKPTELEHYIISGIVTYLGFVKDVTPVISNSSVFVLPSYREGVPRSTQEAMAIGRPVITTNVPGCKETVIDGYNGFLTKKWDVNELIKKMIHFIENPSSIEEMGYNSYKMALEKYDGDKVNERLLQIIEE